ncbi:MAG: hypothetical protein WD904_10110 [Dehalococcoidia bacterium]
MHKLILMLLLPAALVLALAACGDDDDDGGDDGGQTETDAPDDGGDGPVAVTLQEFSVNPSTTTHAAGSIEFDIKNEGPEDVHEFVVLKTDLAANALPTADDGSVDEAGGGIEVEGEVEDLTVGATATLTVDLETGKYVLICNIVEEEDGDTVVHYQNGMRTQFTVE